MLFQFSKFNIYILFGPYIFLYFVVPNAVTSISISNEETNGFEVSWIGPTEGKVEEYDVCKFLTYSRLPLTIIFYYVL